MENPHPAVNMLDHCIPTKTLVKLPGTRVGFSVATHQANPLLAKGTGNFVKCHACLLIV